MRASSSFIAGPFNLFRSGLRFLTSFDRVTLLTVAMGGAHFATLACSGLCACAWMMVIFICHTDRDHFIIPVLCEKGDIQNAITSNHTNHNNNYDLITGGGAEIATKKKYRL